jgi:acetyl-CoA carboxylase biotin carboxyl carrier protein
LSEKRKQRRNGGGPEAADSTGSGPSASDSPMDVRLLEQIVKLMAANDLNTVDVRDGDKRVILKRGAAAPSITYASPMQMPMGQGAPSQPPAAAAGPSAAPSTPAPTDENAGLTPIKAEMVGTFYSAPKPGEKPFVSVGSEVDEETEVCLIEAMKNYFAVKAGVSGTVARVLAQDGQTVQFDQPLFLVRPR